MRKFSIVVILCLYGTFGADSTVVRSKRDEESPSNVTTRQLGMFGFSPPYTPPYGGIHQGAFNSHQPYPSHGSYGGYQPTLTPMGSYQGGTLPMYQQQGFGVGSYPGTGIYPGAGGYPGAGSYPGAGGYPGAGSYPGAGGYPGAGSYPGTSPYGQYPSNNGLHGAASQGPYFPSNPTSSSYPTNAFNPSYGTHPSSNVYNNYNPPVQNGFYNPATSAVTAQNSYRPSGLIPDPFSSVAPIIGTPSYSSASSTGSSYNPSQISPQHNQYKPITIIDTPSYSPSYQGSSSYKPSSSSGSQEGYDSVVVTAQGMGTYDQSSSYKPSSGNYQPVSSQTYYKPQSSSYRPPSSYSQQNSHRPITVQGSIQEIPNTPTYYPSNSQNKPSFYSVSSGKVSFPLE